MPHQDQSFVLAVGLEDSELPESVTGCTHAATARGAIELMRMLRFDLVVIADNIPDMNVWQFVQRMRAAWPWQKWALVAPQLNDRDEITARTLGVTSVIEGAPEWETVEQLAGAIRAHADSHQRVPARSAAPKLRPAASTG